MSRPSSFTPELGARICELIAQYGSLRKICREHDELPSEATVRAWVLDVKLSSNEFPAQYVRARMMGLDSMADDIVEIADTTQEGSRTKEGGINGDITETGDMIEHRKLRVDTRKWYLSKVAPKIYGDRLAVEHSGDVSIVERLNAGRKRTVT